MALPMVLARYRPLIDGALRSALAGYPSPLYDMLRYHLGWLDEQGHPVPGSAGKALRPTLCLLACDALAGSLEQALPAAAALELLHNASLIHDDIQDEDRARRRRPAVWTVWGKAQALNAGSAMALIAGVALQHLADRGVPESRRLRAHRLLYEACLSLVEGQYLDISFEGRSDVTASEYLAMVELKTAALIACSLEIGAMLATDDRQSIAALRECGRNLGLAFQISDDLLGIYGDEARMGKPVGSDIRRRKRTFPTIYALQQVEGAARRRLAQTLASPAGDGHLADVTTILDAVGVRPYTARQVQAYCDCAMRALHGVSLPAWARESLSETARYLAEREA